MKILQLWFALKHFFRRKILIGLCLPKDAVVLDIGSGDKPFWRADVFLDDLSVADAERAGKVSAHRLGIFVDANAELLPFEDQTFDFVYCSHLLEHVGNPDAVIKEMLRVTKSSGGGYIECPSAIVEAISPFSGHRWILLESDSGKLSFFRQSTFQHDAALAGAKFKLRLLNKFNWNGYDLFIQHFWSKREGIAFAVHDLIDDRLKYNHSNADIECNKGEFISHKYLVLLLRKMFRVDVSKNELRLICSTLFSKGYSKVLASNGASVYFRSSS
jgi:SAM-dependent methyltransferase